MINKGDMGVTADVDRLMKFKVFFLSNLYIKATCSFLSLFVIVCFLGYSQGLTPWLDPDSHLVNAIC